jgi:hypothetical protein
MEAESASFPQADLAQTIGTMRADKRLVQRIRIQLESRDPAKKGYVDPAIAEMLIMRTFGMAKHETTTAIRRWSNPWGFNYVEFLEAVSQ